MPEGGATPRSSWPTYAVCWSKADLALSSCDFRTTYTVSVSQSTLQIVSFDGLQPNGAKDNRSTDISALPQVQKKKGDLGLSFGVAPRPIGVALSPVEDVEYLLVLLSSGHLLAASTVHLGAESLLASFPEVSDDHGAGPALAAIRQYGWAVVISGSKLGLVDIAEGMLHGSSVAKMDLPKGTAASMLLPLPEDEPRLLVGCSSGRLLLYSCSTGYKSQVQRLNLTLAVTLDISGVEVRSTPMGFRSSVSKMFGRQDRSHSPRSNSSISDAFVLDGLLVACGSGSSGSLLSAWQSRDVKDTSSGASRSRSTFVSMFGHISCTSSTTKILRILVIAGSHAGGANPIILSLDSFGDITLWSLRPTLSPMQVVPGRCGFEVASGRTFALAGSLHVLVGVGSRTTAEVGWLDAAAFLEAAGRCGANLAGPFAGRTRSRRLTPPFIAGGGVQILSGEIFFVSTSSIRCHKVSNGRTSTIALSTEADWKPMGVLDELHAGGVSYLLLSVCEAPQASAQHAVWIASVEGEVVARIPAVDACFTTSRIVWLSRNSPTRVCHSGHEVFRSTSALPARGEVSPAASFDADGFDRVLGHPDSELTLLWGSKLDTPLYFEAVDGPPSPVGVTLPSNGPMELVDFRWDGHSIQPKDGCCLAIAAPFVLWVLNFQEHDAGWKAHLLCWLDVRAAFSGCGRVLSVAWLKVRDLQSAGVLLLSTPFGVCAWATEPLSRPQVLALYERPQLIVAALLDRLVSVELQAGFSLHAGSDQMSGEMPSSTLLCSRLRARIRTRPVSFFEVLCSLCPGQQGLWMKEIEWRLAPAEPVQDLPTHTVNQLWQAAACAEAPPQLRDSPAALRLLSAAVGEEFRALSAIVHPLSSRKGQQDDLARVVSQMDDCVHGLRSSPGRLPMLGCAASLFVSCSKAAGDTFDGLAIASNLLAKYDLLPLGSLLASIKLYQVHLPFVSCPLLRSSSGVPVYEAFSDDHWSNTFLARAPLAEALLHEVKAQKNTQEFPAVALQQSFTDTPQSKKPQQVIQPGGHQVCQLHTATLMQWLGLGSTQVQVRVFKAIQHEAEESPSSHEESPGHQDRDPAVLASGLLIYWRCGDGEGAQVRDSAGCGRSGFLRGGSWRGPLSPDDPMEPTDEWGQALSPNFAIYLGQAELRYSSSSASDRQMLALVAGNRSEGQDHLTKACDGEEPTPGWTVDFWARMRNSREELLLFSRRSSECAMEWRYVPRLPGFRITLGQQQHLSGSCDPLPEGEWTHLALRSTLDSLEVLVDGELAVTSQQSGLQVTLEADLGFGPADMEITEVRVWGAARSESELLQYQRQCLDTLLSSELRGEAWKRVKIRPAAEGPADSGVLPSLWDISALAQPGGQSRRKNEPQGDLAPASGQTFPPSAPEKEAPKPAWPAWGDFGDWRPFEVAPPVWPENSKQGMEESMESAKLPPSDIVEELPHLVPHKPHTKLPLSTPLLTVGRLMQGIAAKRSEDAAASTVTVEVLPAWQAQATPEVLVPGDPEIFSKSTAGRQDGSLDDSLQGSVRPLERTPASKQPPQLPDVLPPLPAGCSALHGADASVRIAASALNRQAYGFANALFKSVILQLGASGASVAMPALRSRFEAAVSYCCICHLLQLIQEGQEAISKADSSASTRNIQHALCQQWDCLLRLEKAPCHTVQLSLKAAAHLFSFTQAAGGWAAARRVSEVLLENYAPYLDSEQHSQVLYLAEATRHGLQAGRSSAAMLCACPGCGAPLDFLAKTCDTCSALLAVDFSELKLCDLRHASRCSVCAAVFGRGSMPGRARVAGLPHSVRPHFGLSKQLARLP
ncbi:unnamed protein product [Durusdinium trenchii]|uniref:Uncharacterized protein n=1 Tax=Durusdinium trenchii TaxID=1381693 RepID=A0ABP0T194_9DINO